MTESEAKEMLKAYMECDKRKNDVAYEKQCHENCDNCNLCYAQGTVGQQKEAFNMAINALEKQEKIKEAFEMWKTKTSGYYGADDETTMFISTLNKTLRSDEK